MNQWHCMIKPLTMRLVTPEQRFCKKPSYHVINQCQAEWGEVAPFASQARQIAQVTFDAGAATCTLYLTLAAHSSAQTDKIRRAAIARYCDTTFRVEAAHHIRHWLKPAQLARYTLTVAPEYYSVTP